MTKQRSWFESFTDEEWAQIEPLLPSSAGRKGHPFGDNRRVVEGIVYRYLTGMTWRDLPRDQYGPWQTVWKRHRRYAADGTWDKVLAELLKHADAAGKGGMGRLGRRHDASMPRPTRVATSWSARSTWPSNGAKARA